MEQLLKWTASRIGSKAAMQERFSKILSHFTHKITFKVVKVAGTNGKGSVSAMLSACLVEDQKKVGLFTSPHLLDVSERFRINDIDIDARELSLIANDLFHWLKDFVKQAGEEYVPSFFEVLILIAIEYFYKNKVEIAIFEAGVGGKNDATSLLPNLVSLITSIGKDHAQQLGNTLEAIATDKAGISQKQTTTIIQSTITDAFRAIIQHENWTNNIDTFISKNYVEPINQDTILLKLPQNQISLHPTLKGDFQLENINLVIETCLFLKKQKYFQQISSLKGIEKTKWNARFEIVKGNPPFIIDAAHNEPALKALVKSLQSIVPFNDRVLILGISKEKDLVKMSPLIAKIASKIYLTDDFYKSRSVENLQDNLTDLPIILIPKQTIASLINYVKATHPTKTIIVTGSIFMIGKARTSILNNHN